MERRASAPIVVPRTPRLAAPVAAAAALLVAGCYVTLGDGIGIGVVDITQQPADVTATVGAQASFAVGVAGTTPLSFQWMRNETSIDGANAFSYTTPPVTRADNGARFSVRVCTSLACQLSRSATLTVL